MRRFAAFAALAVAAISAVPAEAQYRRRGDDALILNVRPRSYLDAGNVVRPNSSVNPASAYGQTASYLNLPPYVGMRERYGASNLPDPITNGPFVGARNPFGPIGD